MLINIWNFIKILFLPILFLLGQMCILVLFMIFFIIQNPGIDLNNDLSTKLLSEYINDSTLVISFLQFLIFLPIFYLMYKKYCVNKIDYSFKSVVLIAVISFLISVVLNFIIIGLKILFGIKMTSSPVTFVVIVATGIVGPILEEFLFRGIVYNKFLKIFKEKTAFYLSILVFAIFHTGGIFQILFAAIIGYFLTYIYRKYHDIKLSMMAHIIVNITSVVMSPFILMIF